MRKIVLTCLRIIYVVGAFLFLCVTLDAVMLHGPWILASALTPSAKRRCQTLKIGMSRMDVLKRIDGFFPAPSESLRETSITFAEGGGSCVVDFTPETNSVRSTNFEPAQGKEQWDLHGDEYPDQ